MNVPDRLRPVLIALLALVAGGVFGSVVIDQSDDGHGHKTTTVTVHAGRQPTAPQGDLAASKPTPENAVAELPSESELRDETPPDVPAATLEQGKQINKTLEQPKLTAPQPTGGAQNYSCRQDFSGHVYSDRPASIKPTEFFLHYTVSPNVKGWGDVYGTADYFKRTRVGSATYIMDFEAHCLQMVPLSAKPWTQGNANPWAIASVEIIATGKETRADWLGSPLFKTHALAELVRDRLRGAGAPLKFVDPKLCTYPPGYTDHDHIECGNDHTDVAPACAPHDSITGAARIPWPKACTGFPFDVLQKQIGAQDDATAALLKARRSHRIVHAKITKRCRGRARHSAGCSVLFKRNGQLHAKYGRALG